MSLFRSLHHSCKIISFATLLLLGLPRGLFPAAGTNYAEMGTALATMLVDIAANHYAFENNATKATVLGCITDMLSLTNKSLFLYNNKQSMNEVAFWTWKVRDCIVNGGWAARDATKLLQGLTALLPKKKTGDASFSEELKGISGFSAAEINGLDLPKIALPYTETAEGDESLTPAQKSNFTYARNVIVLPVLKGLTAFAIACTQRYTTAYSSDHARFTATAAHSFVRFVEELAKLDSESSANNPLIIALFINTLWLAYEGNQYHLELKRVKGHTQVGTCEICGEDNQTLRILGCNKHSCCQTCLENMVQTQFTNKRSQLDSTPCPDPACKHHLTRSEIQGITGNRADIMRGHDIAAFDRAHPNFKTLDPVEQELIHSGKAKLCPKCRRLINKTEGCNHMKCLCGAHFCYVCSLGYEGYQYYHPGCPAN